MSVFVLSFLTQTLPVFAADEAFYSKNDILFYNPDEAVCAATGSPDAITVLSGDSIEEQVWNFFTGKGLTPEQTAGVMGNISHESGFNPAAIEGDTGVGFGLVQWSGGRRTAIEQAAVNSGRSASDLAFQLDYLYAELNARGINRPEYAGLTNEWIGLTKQTTVDDAVVFFHNEYEISFLSNFDIPGYKSPYIDRVYPSARAAVIGERGGYVTPEGLDYGGKKGAQYYYKNFTGVGAASVSCTTNATGAVHPIADGTRVNEGYGGPRPGPGAVQCKGVKWHNGYDLAGSRNTTPVLSAMAGVVTRINYGAPSLNTVSIQNPDGFTIQYLHMNNGQIDVKVGDQVTAGQVIGTVGDGNGNYGTHLHIQIEISGNTNPQVAELPVVSCGGNFVNPDSFLKLFGVTLCDKGGCDNAITE